MGGTLKNRIICSWAFLHWVPRTITTEKLGTTCWNCFPWISGRNSFLFFLFFACHKIWRKLNCFISFFLNMNPRNLIFYIWTFDFQGIFKQRFQNSFFLTFLIFDSFLENLWISNSSGHHGRIFESLSMHFAERIACKLVCCCCRSKIIELKTFLFLMSSCFGLV